MSEALDKVKGIRHLPLFPLPLVMLPNELLPLHIFEERYQQMVSDLEREQGFFGILRSEAAGSLPEKPAAGTVGCAAEIKEIEMLPDGRSNLLTLGLLRFKLIDYVETGDPYFVGDVEFFEDETKDPSVLTPLSDDVFSLFERMARAAFTISGNRGRFPEIIRTDPESLSFLITAAFNFDNAKKYELLEMTSTSERLLELKNILSFAVNQMEETAQIQKASRTNGHSTKKIDL